MQEAKVSNPNDHRVVSFRNSTDFGFTPTMGCMYDGRPINGSQGGPGINAGESLTVPYHIGRQLAVNLAKIAITKTAPAVDPAGIPTGVPLWDDQRLNNLRDSYLTDLYTEEKPVSLSETDRLMAKVEEYKKMVDQLVASKPVVAEVPVPTPVVTPVVNSPTTPVVPIVPVVFQDKAEVIAELEKRGIQHDKRQNKANLEKLLV